MFAMKFSLEKGINFFWIAGFFLPAINATVCVVKNGQKDHFPESEKVGRSNAPTIKLFLLILILMT